LEAEYKRNLLVAFVRHPETMNAPPTSHLVSTLFNKSPRAPHARPAALRKHKESITPKITSKSPSVNLFGASKQQPKREQITTENSPEFAQLVEQVSQKMQVRTIVTFTP
jgi:hypothetical protein